MNTTTSATVTMSGVEFGYRTLPVLRGVDLEVRAGETVALLGLNGAGKTTAIRTMLGLLTPTAGEVRVAGTSPAHAARDGRIGAMLQGGRLLPKATVGDLLTFIAALYRDPLTVAEAADRAELGDLLRRPVERLSGGQAQRVRFALAVIGRPELLVLDEPTSAMDVPSRREFWEHIDADTADGRAVLFCTHLMEEAEAADRVIVMAGGRIVANGTSAQIAAHVALATVSVARVPDEVLRSLCGRLQLDPAGQRQEADRTVLTGADPDAIVLALAADGLVRDLRVSGASLEDALLSLTATSSTPTFGGTSR